MGKFILKEISVPVREAYNADIKSIIEQKVRKSYGNNDINFVSFQKKSIDARHKNNIQYSINAVFESDDDFIEKRNWNHFPLLSMKR